MTTNNEPDLGVQRTGSGEICASILQQLPQWFGIPEANADYAVAADAHPTVVARIEGRPIGLLTLVQHSDQAAEVHLMAVLPERHRQGLGATMLCFAEQHLVEQGITFLQVKTLAEEHPDPGYAKTRAFYRAVGFVTLEVFPELWDSENPALQLIKYIGSETAPQG